MDSVQTTDKTVACLHDATYAFDRDDNLDGQSNKQGKPQTDRAALYGNSSDQKESPVVWTLHDDIGYQS